MSSPADEIFARALRGTMPGDDGEPVDLPAGLGQALSVLYRAEALVRAATATQAHLRTHVAILIGEGGAYREADTVYRSSRRKAKRIVTPGMDNALMAWLGEDLAKAVNAAAVRITSVRGIAEQRYREKAPINEALEPDFEDRIKGHVVATEHTFYTWDEDPEAEPAWELTKLPVAKAPKFLQALEPGEKLQPKREKESI